jgi:hypothetical protein
MDSMILKMGIILASLSVLASGQTFSPISIDDYGSGASINTAWYSPGGLGKIIGVFVGHPNVLARSDRALVRFNLDSLLIKPADWISRHRARIRFKISSFIGDSDTRKIEITYMAYDPWKLTGDDLVNNNVQVAGIMTVSRKDCVGRAYSLDVTQEIQKGLLQGNKYFCFRFRDVEAEAGGNPNLTPQGVGLLLLQNKEPILEIIGSRQ